MSSFNPGTVATVGQPHDDFFPKLGIAANIIFLVMGLLRMNLSIGQIALTHGLHSCMKINPPVYSHQVLPSYHLTLAVDSSHLTAEAPAS